MTTTTTTGTAPFAFLATYQVIPGRADDLEALAAEYAAAVEESESQTHALGLYLDAERTRFSHLQVLADSAAMEEHLVRIQDYLQRAAASVRIASIAVHGDVGPRLRVALVNNVAAGAALEIQDGPAFGFARAASAAG